MAPRPSRGNEAESSRILSRIARQADAVAFPRAPVPPEDEDWAEVWGRRIGAVLGPLLVLALGAWFLFFLAQRGG